MRLGVLGPPLLALPLFPYSSFKNSNIGPIHYLEVDREKLVRPLELGPEISS